MSEATLMVPTAFSDISQLAEGLTGRVESDRLMLYGPEPYDPGTTVRFSLTLDDGGVAFEGTGRAIHSVDGGVERPEVARFDIILDSLEFAGSGQVVYDRILLELQGDADYAEPDAHEVVPASDYTVDDSAFEEVAAGPHIEGGGQSGQDNAEGVDIVDVDDTAFGGGDGATEIVDYQDAGAGMEAAASAAEPSLVEPDTAHEEEWPAAPPDETYSGSHSGATTPDEGYPAPGWDAAEEAEGASVDIALGDDAAPAGFDDVSFGDSDVVDTTDEIDVSDVALDSSLYADGSSPASAIDEAPPMPPAPRGFEVELRVSPRQVLSRLGLEATWQPVLAEGEPSRPASGYFQFSGGLPAPAVPPRPDLDPSYRVDPAPRPGQPGAGTPGPALAAPSHVAGVESVESVAPPNGSSDPPPDYYEVGAQSAEDHEAARDTDAPNPYDPGEVDVDVGSFPPTPGADGDVEASFDDVARDVDDSAWLDPDLPEADHRER